MTDPTFIAGLLVGWALCSAVTLVGAAVALWRGYVINVDRIAPPPTPDPGPYDLDALPYGNPPYQFGKSDPSGIGTLPALPAGRAPRGPHGTA